MKKIISIIKKNIFGVIIGLMLGSVSIYAGSKFYAKDVFINTPTGSSLGSNATLQESLDELYSKINSYKKLYPNGTAVYYNPTTGEKCTESESKSTTGTKSGCMKWYTFNDSEGNTSINLILDHNTTANVAYNSSGSNSEMNEVARALSNDTKTWLVGARLITANEVAKITGNTNFDANKTGQNWFCLDTNNQDNTNYCAKAKGESKYKWLFDYTYDCTSYGCDIADSSTWGYWTSSIYVGSSSTVWRVYRNGYFYNYTVSNYNIGIRPVITISKSILK